MAADQLDADEPKTGMVDIPGQALFQGVPATSSSGGKAAREAGSLGG
jgi:hypothetical protein